MTQVEREATPASSLTARRQWVILACVAIVAAGLRFAWIGSDCLWFDEIWHVELSNGTGSAHARLPVNELVPHVASFTSLDSAAPIWRIPANMDAVLHPPLYHLVLRLWRQVFRLNTTAGVRSLSAALSVAAIVAMFRFARLLLPAVNALWATMIMAISTTQITQAQDARGYTLLLLLGLIAAEAMIRLERNRGRARPAAMIVLGLAVLGMLFTHYFAAGAWAALLGYASWRLRGTARVSATAVILIALGMFLLLWLPTLREQLRGVHEWADVFLKDDVRGHLPRTFLDLAALPARLLIDVHERALSLTSIASTARPLFALAGLAIWSLLVIGVRRHPGLLLPCLIFIGTAGMLLALDLARGTRHLDFIRYSFVASPAICLVLGAFTVEARRQWTSMIPALAFACCLVLLPVAYRRDNPDCRPMAALIEHRAAPDDVLVLCSSNSAGREAQVWALYLDFYSHLFPRDVFCLAAGASAEGRSGWIVSVDPSVSPQAIMPGGAEVERYRYSVGVCYRVRAP
jgi:uncharacterized membrane protein